MTNIEKRLLTFFFIGYGLAWTLFIVNNIRHNLVQIEQASMIERAALEKK